jgi:hypothetical protein
MLDAVIINVVVDETLTLVLPFAATEPTPLSIEIVVASVVVQDSVLLPPPKARVEGVAVKVGIVGTGGGGGTELTVTLTLANAVPLGPTAVRLNVVLAVTEVPTLPDVATDPTPLSIVTLVAFAVAHDRVTAPPPNGRVVGRTVKLVTVGGGAAATGTVTEAVREPVMFVAVNINVVVVEMVIEPLPSTATEPIPLSMVTVVAPVVVQLSMPVPPGYAKEEGVATKVSIVGRGGGGATVTVTLENTVPPGPRATIL